LQKIQVYICMTMHASCVILYWCTTVMHAGHSVQHASRLRQAQTYRQHIQSLLMTMVMMMMMMMTMCHDHDATCSTSSVCCHCSSARRCSLLRRQRLQVTQPHIQLNAQYLSSIHRWPLAGGHVFRPLQAAALTWDTVKHDNSTFHECRCISALCDPRRANMLSLVQQTSGHTCF